MMCVPVRLQCGKSRRPLLPSLHILAEHSSRCSRLRRLKNHCRRAPFWLFLCIFPQSIVWRGLTFLNMTRGCSVANAPFVALSEFDQACNTNSSSLIHTTTMGAPFDFAPERPDHMQQILDGLDRYNPETTGVFQDYVMQQCENQTYDCYANLALLKLYVSPLLFPPCYKMNKQPQRFLLPEGWSMNHSPAEVYY